MGKVIDQIDAALQRFIESQQMFFVATAPPGADGHVNISPKGLDTLRVLAPAEVAYLDYVGSGAETIGHLRANRRITLMFCAFEGTPKIVRLYGQGEVLDPDHPRFALLRPLFAAVPPARSIIVVRVQRVATACGFGVPLYRFEGQRTQLAAWAARKGEAGLLQYQRQKNATTIDALPAVDWVQNDSAFREVTSHIEPVELRRARPEDAEAIASAHIDSIESLGPAVYPPEIVQAWREGVTPALYVNAMEGGEAFFVAIGDLDGAPGVLGFATHRVDDAQDGASVYVRGRAARRGIGTALLRLAEAHAREHGAASIEIQASLAGVPFYKANGFQELARGEAVLTSGRKMPCVFMRKVL